ncbi:MAG: class II SORL domain-containing protein [Synergistaceae bacterium]|jgi:superoxide reductase|nr:class II SORL domain-containing protein [Synergistaceae bacterium]
MKLGDFVQSGDWKGEKHVPVIEAPESVKAGEAFKVGLCVGREIAHPNTAAHHIEWIKLLFVPDGGKFAIELANLSFDAHGDTANAERPGPAFADPFGSVIVKLSSSGTLAAQSYCNIHGLWESSRTIAVS